MNYLDIILWTSAIGLWVWVLIEIVSSINKFRTKVEDTKNKAHWAREHINSVRDVCFDRYNGNNTAIEHLTKRLDAIEKQMKKGKK